MPTTLCALDFTPARAMSDPYEEFFMMTGSQPKIYEPILHASSPGTIFLFGKTCKLAKHCVEVYHRTAFNIDRHLGHFLLDPVAFRNLQACTVTIISGSNVKQFLDRTHYEKADLDIYMNPGHGREVGVHMVQTQGYRVV